MPALTYVQCGKLAVLGVVSSMCQRGPGLRRDDGPIGLLTRSVVDCSFWCLGSTYQTRTERYTPSGQNLYSDPKAERQMATSYKVPWADIYALNEYFYKEPVAGVAGAYMRTHKPYIVIAKKLGNALKALELARAVTITPYDGSWETAKFDIDEPPKYFIYGMPDGSQSLVDIHIIRLGEHLCPKQDLNFVLQDGDIIVPGALIC
jgi:hypothetical protein